MSWSVFPSGSNGGQFPYCDIDAGPEPPSCGGGQNYSFADNGGCSAVHDCSTLYNMNCQNGSCRCLKSSADGGVFAQGDTCDNGATMKRAFVRKCGYPTQ